MKGILLLNGEPYTNDMSIFNGEYVVCCDGAYLWAKDKIKIDMLLGDFDSLNELPTHLKVERFPVEKDYTDGESGIKLLIEKGVDEIIILGGDGKRLDHFLGNLQLLYLAYKEGVDCKMITKQSTIYISSGIINFNNLKGKTISLLPFLENAHIIDSDGFKYPIKDLTLKKGECRGISNILLKDEGYINCDSNCLLIIENNFI